LKIKIFCLITVLMLIISGGVFAQNTQELSIGSSLPGNLSSGQEIWYSVKAAQDGLLIVQTFGDTDTCLEAFDEGMFLIVDNDDGPNGYNASIILSVKRGSTYYFCLTGYDNESGPYSISASYPVFPQLNAGSFHSGNIISDDYLFFIFTAARSGVLTVETSGGTDTYIYLYDDNLKYLADDDDGAGYPNDRLIYQVTSGRTYYIELCAYEFGPYTISARLQ